MENLLADEERPTRTDSVDKKRVRCELDDEGLDSPDVKRLRDDLFDFLDESVNNPVSQDLDTVIKSFEIELSSATTVEISGDETQPDLGYLFEASDDELGLPPPPPSSTSVGTEETVPELVASSDTSGAGDGELYGFEDHIPDYESFELGDGLFEYSDVCLDAGDLFSWRPESLPAE